MPRNSGHFNVAPRYTPGSPALVGEETALRVALEERGSIEHALEGAWGEKQQERAKRLGLRGIVEYRIERGSGKKQGWEVLDVITGEKFFRLCSESLRKFGWRHYPELADWEKKLVDAEGFDEESIPDHTKCHYKLEVGPFTTYPNGYKIRVYRPELLNSNIWPWLALRPKEGEAAL